MIDITIDDGNSGNLWSLFRDRVEGVAVPVCVAGNIDDAALPTQVGWFDVVHCGGVLYHCPHPTHTLRQLERITRETLILVTTPVSSTIESDTGRVSFEPGSALFVPAMESRQRAILGDWFRAVGVEEAIGVTRPVDRWSLDDYAAWWWLFTPQHVAALLRVSGFEVVQMEEYWGGQATLYVAKKAPAGSNPAAGVVPGLRRAFSSSRLLGRGRRRGHAPPWKPLSPARQLSAGPSR